MGSERGFIYIKWRYLDDKHCIGDTCVHLEKKASIFKNKVYA